MPTARVDIIIYIADTNDSRKITLLMNTYCEFFSWPKSLMKTWFLQLFHKKQGGCQTFDEFSIKRIKLRISNSS